MVAPYRAPSPSGGSDDAGPPLSLHLAPVHPAVRPDATTTTYAVATIRANATSTGRARPRLTGVLVLDVSGSMQGEPLAQVLFSARRLAELLDDQDRLAVVTFADAAHTAAPLTTLGTGRREIAQRLSLVEANGRTNISGGLAQAALLFPKREPNERQVALVLSDGEPNLGAVTAEELRDHAKMLKGRDVSVSALGFGVKHNDEMLAAIADGGGGRYSFVIDPKLSEASFIRAIGAQLDVVAERVELLLTPRDDVEIVRVLESPPTAVSAAGMRVTLADLVVGDELHVVVEVRVRSSRETGPMPLLTATLSCAAAGTSRSQKVQQTADVLVTSTGSIDSDPAAHAVLSVALATEAREKARALADRGSYADAEAVLRKAQATIAATPGFVQGDKSGLADAYEALADDITVMAKRPVRAEYEVYKRAQRDQAEFSMSGTKPRPVFLDAPPSTKGLFERAYRDAHVPHAYLHVVRGPTAGTRLRLTAARVVIGRGQGICDLQIAHPSVSRQHCAVELRGASFWLFDLGSTNRAQFKGAPVESLELVNGMEIEIGNALLRYEEEPDPR